MTVPKAARATTFTGISFAASAAAYGWAVGRPAMLLSTTIGGKAWKVRPRGPLAHLDPRAVTTISASEAWVVARRPSTSSDTVYRTTDAGATWPLVWASVRSCLYADPAWAWAATWDYVNATVARSHNGGWSWLPVTFPIATPLQALCFVSTDDVGWGVGAGGGIVCSTDGGATWAPQPTDRGSVYGLRDLAVEGTVPGPLTLYTIGRGMDLWRSTDAGMTWGQTQIGTYDSSNYYRAIAFADATHLQAVGTWRPGSSPVGIVERSTDAGLTWSGTAMQVPSAGDLFDVTFADALHGWIVGGTMKYRPTSCIMRTSDGGTHWSHAEGPVGQVLLATAFAGAKAGWAVGTRGSIIHTTNGDATWKVQDSEVKIDLCAIACVGARSAWAVGDRGTILHTANGGATWIVQHAPTARYSLSAIDMVDAQNGWAVGGGGNYGLPDFQSTAYAVILKTDGGGRTWKKTDPHASQVLNAAWAPDASTALAVGDCGTILETGIH